MKKILAIVFCFAIQAAVFSAEGENDLSRNIPADTVFAIGIDMAKLYTHPAIRKYFSDTFVTKTLEEKTGAAALPESLDYLLISSSELSGTSFNVMLQMRNAAALQETLAKSKDITQVQYGSLTAHRIASGMEFAFPAENLVLASTSSLKSYLDAKKGLPDNLANLFGKNKRTFASAFLILPDDLKKTNPAATGLDRITCSLEAAGETSSDLIFRANAACSDADATRKTMMLAQQLQLLAGVFINNLDPDLAQDFNKSAVVKTEGNNVHLQFLITEKLIQKLSVLTEPGVLKGMMADDSDF